MEKLPPIEKIPEAWSAIADGRVSMLENEAEVHSSNWGKIYVVRWDENTYSSTDSATYWQRYAGYPILAVLMMQGRLPLNRQIATNFGEINWTDLNNRHKRDYSAAVAEVMSTLRQKGIDTAPITEEMQLVYQALSALTINTKRGRNKR